MAREFREKSYSIPRSRFASGQSEPLVPLEPQPARAAIAAADASVADPRRENETGTGPGLVRIFQLGPVGDPIGFTGNGQSGLGQKAEVGQRPGEKPV